MITKQERFDAAVKGMTLHFLGYANERMGRAGCNDFPEFDGFFKSKEDQAAA